MDANGIRCLVDLLTLAHLHTSRATVPTQVRMFHCLTKKYALILSILSALVRITSGHNKNRLTKWNFLIPEIQTVLYNLVSTIFSSYFCTDKCDRSFTRHAYGEREGMVLRKCRKGAAGSVQLRRSKYYCYSFHTFILIFLVQVAKLLLTLMFPL